MSDIDQVACDIERLVRAAPTLRALVINTVTLADQVIDYARYVREMNPRLVLSGLNAKQRFDALASDVGGCDTDLEMVRYGNCFFFPILGHAYELSTALPNLNDDQLAHNASQTVQAICEIPAEYVPVFDSDNQDTTAPVPVAPELDDEFCLRNLFANALIYIGGWMQSTYDPRPLESIPNEHLGEDELLWLAQDEIRSWAEYDKQDEAHRKRGGSCNFVMAD